MARRGGLEQLFMALLEDRDPDEPFVQMFWAPGHHLGEAIDRMLEAARLQGVQHPSVNMAGLCDSIDQEDDTVEGPDGVLWAAARHYYDADEEEPSLIFPHGIVATFEDEGQTNDVDDLRPGYKVSPADDDGFYSLHVNVDGHRLRDDY